MALGASFLATHHPSLPLDTMHAATSSEDAFDAVVTALGMWRYRETVAHLTIATDPEIALEGWIWDPVGRG